MPATLPSLWFNYIHSNYLVYNISWEDSDIDRTLLQINSESNLLTITSAGCNVLNYLLDSPQLLHTIDINPKQTALLELKVALIRINEFEHFFDFFGKGKSKHFRSVYAMVRDQLTYASQSFWDTQINYFNPEGRGLFYSGGAGMFARYLNRIITKKKLDDIVSSMVHEVSQERREELYASIEEHLWSGVQASFWKSSIILSLAGIPKSQHDAIGDMNSFMKEALRNIFIKQSASTNYFWRVYLEGQFSENSCPDYLKYENYELLQNNIHKLHISTNTVHNFLNDTNENFSHIVLLDYMDWLAGNNPDQLKRNWENTIKSSHSGSKILFRTAHADLNFLPSFVESKVKISQVDKEWIAKMDKVGTYTGTYLGKVL